MPERSLIGEDRAVTRNKVKTGCTTCRIRKIKCDERKPACQKCVGTGRTCGGYDLSFRNYQSQPGQGTIRHGAQSSNNFKLVRGPSAQVALRDFELLGRYFSTKTSFGADLDCSQEARHILEACRAHASIQHAVTSLVALRNRFEMVHGDHSLELKQGKGREDGILHYNLALRSLISALSFENTSNLQSTLLCCQLFISIEQVQRNYDSMARHIVRGLNIMHAHRARPSLDAANTLVSAHREQLPLVDVFVIKLFAAPCSLDQAPTRREVSTPASDLHRQLVPSSDVRAIAPDKRTELKKIAFQVLRFLDCVSRIKSVQHAHDLLTHKHTLLMALRSWLVSPGSSDEMGCSEPISSSLMRLFHRILELILLRSLNCSTSQLHLESDRLQKIADDVAERLRQGINVGSTSESTAK